MAKRSSNHHDNASYYECFAQLILNTEFAASFSHSDRPDLVDVTNNIGVEVTSAFPKGYDQAVRMMCSQKRIYGTLKDIGYENTDTFPGVLLHPGKKWEHGKPFPTFQYLIDGIEKKVDKAKDYRYIGDLRLFVFADSLPDDLDTMSGIVNTVIQVNNDEFTTIYIKYCDKLLIIDSTKRKYSRITINNETELGNEALRLEIQWENSNE